MAEVRAAAAFLLSPAQHADEPRIVYRPCNTLTPETGVTRSGVTQTKISIVDTDSPTKACLRYRSNYVSRGDGRREEVSRSRHDGIL